MFVGKEETTLSLLRSPIGATCSQLPVSGENEVTACQTCRSYGAWNDDYCGFFYLQTYRSYGAKEVICEL